MIQDSESTHVENQIASISTRKTHIIPSINNQLTTKHDIPNSYKIDMSPFVKRTFYLGTASWSENDASYSILNLPIQNLPADVILSNKSLYNAIKVGSLMKPSLKIHVSLNGTLAHSGCVLVGILPPGCVNFFNSVPNFGTSHVDLVNTLMSGPNVRLFANEATSAILEVPWFCNTDLSEAYIEDLTENPVGLAIQNTPAQLHQMGFSRSKGAGCYAQILALVLNPLRPGGGSAPLTMVFEAVFDEFELAVPTPRFISVADWIPQSSTTQPLWKQVTTGLLDLGSFGAKTFYPVYGDAIDKVRGLIRAFTGLHNPNIPSIDHRVISKQNNFINATDIPQFFERLDPINNFNRIYKEPMFGSNIDEMSLKYIASKKQYIGTFHVSTTTPIGSLLFSRPISPNQGGSLGPQPFYVADDVLNQDRVHSNNLELLHAMHRYWRGSLDVTIESVMNNKSHCKLKIIKYYNPSQKIVEAYPTMQSLSNAPSQLVEFSSGGQKYCVDLPYLHRNELMPCCEDYTSEALMHGVYLIYLAQPLIIGDNSPTDVSFNVFMSGSIIDGENLQFYGYINKNIRLLSLTPSSTNVSEIPAVQNWQPQSSQSCMPSVKPMNEPQDQEITITEEFPNGITQKPNHFNRLIPNYDIRPLMRRMYRVLETKVIDMNGVTSVSVNYPLSTLISETILPPEFPKAVGTTTGNNLNLISSMYYGKASTGVKFKTIIHVYKKSHDNTLLDFDTSVHFVPPSSALPAYDDDQVMTFSRTTPNIDRFSDVEPGIEFQLPEVPVSISPIKDSTNTHTHEFFVPDLTPYKFIGSPYKFLRLPNLANTPPPTSDLGSIVIYIRNFEKPVQGNEDKIYVEVTIFAGLADETRFGYHSIAPLFIVRNGIHATYSHYRGSELQDTVAKLPITIYKSHPNSG